ncbi:response regulator transcription factor [Geodermatophilus sp. SYSU D00705]
MTLAQLDRRTGIDQIRVLVVDDHRTFAELLSGALASAGMQAVGTAHSAAQAVAMAQDLQPDVVVMDIEMPRQDGLAATRRVREVAPRAVVAVVTAHRDPDWVVRAAQAGASAFIPKDGSLAEMIDVLSRVQAGQMLVAPSTFAGGPTCAPSASPDRVAPPQLTRREQEVLDCLGRGMQVKAIARVLGITLETCRGYVKSLHAKLGVRSQLEAVVKAQQLGLLGSMNEH